jgi:hypothetical protein
MNRRTKGEISMHPIAQTFELLFHRQNWRYVKRDEYQYGFGFRIGSNRYDLTAQIGDNRNTLSIYIKIPMQAPVHKMQEVSEFISRVNWDMILGNFEMDYDDGEIRYKTSISFLDRDPDPDDINDMVECSLAMAERYYPGFGMVIFGGQSAESAVKHVEA